MSEDKAPNEYTQTRTEFGIRAINTAKAVRVILEELIGGYHAINNITPPGHGTSTSGQSGSAGTPSAGTGEEDERAGFDPHDPWFLNDAIKALNELIKFTESKYL